MRSFEKQATGGTIAQDGSELGQGDPRLLNVFSGTKSVGAQNQRTHDITSARLDAKASGTFHTFITDAMKGVRVVTQPVRARRSAMLRSAVRSVLVNADYKAKMAKAMALAAREFA